VLRTERATVLVSDGERNSALVKSHASASLSFLFGLFFRGKGDAGGVRAYGAGADRIGEREGGG
jgi:hypothetical protein